MPELPEVETVRSRLAEALPARRVVAVHRGGIDVVRAHRRDAPLLAGDRVAEVLRHGKQLALIGETGEAVCVHLGMSGSLRLAPPGEPIEPHTHVCWRFQPDRGGGPIELRFRDPRRFGGVWSFPDPDTLRRTRWARLGPDALRVGPAALRQRLTLRRIAIKPALLDQTTLAGLGNIYVDELLFALRLHPLRPAGSLAPGELASLVRRMRTLLNRAIAAGGSTLRDYVGAHGEPGGFQRFHRVYGREGRACPRRGCAGRIARSVIAGRGTFTCPVCQRDAV